MGKNELFSKFADLEERIFSLEEKNDRDFDENSVIALFLDVFNFKKFLEIIFYNQKRIRFTQNSIHIILLFLFLLFIFWQNEILQFSRSPATITLGIIFFAGIFEILGANTSLFKRFFVKNTKTKLFFEKLPSMSAHEIKTFIKNQTFSTDCINYFIRNLENKDKYSPAIVYQIISTQVIRTENLDLLFSSSIIKNLHPDLIIRVLYKCENFLKYQHIETIYENFKHRDDVIKVLFATQKYSECLLDLKPTSSEVKEYYNKFQIETKHVKGVLKIYPINNIPLFITFMYISISSIITIIIAQNDLNAFIDSPQILVASFFLGLVITVYVLIPLVRYLNKQYRQYYIKSIIQT